MRKKLDQASGHSSGGADQERRQLLRAMLGGAYVIPLAASLSVDQLDWEYDDDVQLIGGGKKKAAKKKAAKKKAGKKKAAKKKAAKKKRATR